MTGHDHDHSAAMHAPRRRLAIAFGITTSILVAEIIGAVTTGSLALLVDAAHMLTDAGSLAVALFAATLTTRPATAQRTWGFGRAEVIAAAAQAGVLLAVGLFVLIEAVQRLLNPPELAPTQLLVFGIIGLLGNVASILVLASSRSANFNLRAAFLEVVNDALGSVAVIGAAVVILVTGWTGADSVAAILIGVLILPRAITLLRETLNVLLEATPKGGRGEDSYSRTRPRAIRPRPSRQPDCDGPAGADRARRHRQRVLPRRARAATTRRTAGLRGNPLRRERRALHLPAGAPQPRVPRESHARVTRESRCRPPMSRMTAT
jgi:cobalt-zinc-cadmium efflux system protein